MFRLVYYTIHLLTNSFHSCLWRLQERKECLLLVFPYTAGALYYLFYCKGKHKTFYALGFFVPSITEKIIIYLLSACIYDINPLYITSVMQKIVDEGSHIRQDIDGVRTYYPYFFSFFSWDYVFGGLLISIIMTIFLVQNH